MGIKENFTQAVRELTGSAAKEKEADKKNAPGVPLEELRKAVEADNAEPAREIKLADTDTQPQPQNVVPPLIPPQLQPLPQSSEQPDEYMSPFDDNDGFSGASAPMPLRQEQPRQVQPPPAFTPREISIPQPQNLPNPAESAGFAGGFESPGVAQGISATPFVNTRPFQSEESEITVISRNTVIDGHIRSFADMNIEGDVKGDIETTKNVSLNGKVVGDITCNNAQMFTSQIQGNIRMKGNAVMKRDTLLIGDLMSTYAEINGKVKGNLDVVGKADLRGDAVVFGDISASTITVEDGAIIQGYVSTTFLNKEESKNIFPDTVIIGGE